MTKNSNYRPDNPTKNYDMFSLVLVNRTIKQRGIEKVKRQILRKDLRHENEIKVNHKYQVMEGQHTLMACKELDLPVYWRFSDMTVEDIAEFNSSRTSWCLTDYIEANAHKGNVGCKKLLEYSHQWGLSIDIVKHIFLYVTGANIENIKKSTFVLSDEAEVEGKRLYRMLTDIQKYYDHVFDTAFIRAFKIVKNNPGYRHETLIDKLHFSANRMKKCPSIKEYVLLIQAIYNNRNKNKVRFINDL